MPPIPVRTYGEMPDSPHRINLRDSATHEVWQNVSVYREDNSSVDKERNTVDFGKLVASSVEHFTPLVIQPKVPWREQILSWFESMHSFFSFKKIVPIGLTAILVASLPFPAVGYYRKLKNASTIVAAESTNGFLALQSSTVAAFHSNLPVAETDLMKALQSFAAAESVLEKDHKLLVSFAALLPIIGEEIESRDHLLAAGHHLALGNTYMVKGVRDASATTDSSLTDRFGVIRSHLRSALPQYQAALDRMQQVKITSIPVEYQETFEQLQLLFAGVVDDISDLLELIDAIQLVFGGDSFKRYLVVFQNHHELRPTGGFLGSFAIIDVQKGKIMNIEVPGGGTYDIKGQVDAYVKPPLPLQLVNNRWEFQDANWFPDFAASAQKIEWFFEQGRHSTVDGVIALNGSVLERLLRVVGPLSEDRFGLVLSSDTVLSQLEQVVESETARESGKPKTVLADLLAEIMDALQAVEPRDIVRLLAELHGALDESEIQVFFNDSELEKTFRRYGWTGEITPTTPGQDYLGIVHSNLQGQKSDRDIEEIVDHQVVVGPDGTVEDTVVIQRSHRGAPGEALYGVPNTSYVRLYVPEGSVLLDAGGFTFPPEEAFHVPEPWYTEDTDRERLEQNEGTHVKTGTQITREFGKTVFGNWMRTNPGETSEVFFTYRLPFKISMNSARSTTASWQSVFLPSTAKQFSSYHAYIEKQSGTHTRVTSRVIYPTGWTPVWKSDERMDLAKNGAEMSFLLTTDQSIGLGMEHD